MQRAAREVVHGYCPRPSAVGAVPVDGEQLFDVGVIVASRCGNRNSTYQRTDWLGTMNAVVDGGSERLRERQAATTRMSNANTAIRSIVRGSCSCWPVFQRIDWPSRAEAAY